MTCNCELAVAAPDEPTPGPVSTAGLVPWSGVAAFEGIQTGDGRVFAVNALRWDLTTPLPLSIVFAASEGHDGAVVVGTVTGLSRGTHGQIDASGTIDTTSPDGAETARLISTGTMTRVSVDLDDLDVEVWVRSELLDETLLVAAAGEGLPDPGRYEPVGGFAADDEVAVIRSARVRGLTVVALSAFADAVIHLDDDDTPTDTPDPGLVAAAAPVRPPREWFTNPHLAADFSGVHITDTGQITARVATWNTCHIAYSSGGQCVTAPRSTTAYTYYLTGTVRCDDGTDVPTGRLTMGTGHAPQTPGVTAASAAAHYDNTGTAVADVTAGEDEYGIWLAGALRPNVTDEQVRTLRGSPLSGDWRTIGGGLEMVAVLAVNVPGFPVPRPRALVADGRVVSLVAAGTRKPATDGTRLANRVRLSRTAMQIRHPNGM